MANMLISTYGHAAEEKAELKITEARENNDQVALIVWTAILMKIGEIRSKN
nr:hypothetical protein [uncultured Sphingomonas sp.]